MLTGTSGVRSSGRQPIDTGETMRRREFIALAGASVAWPFAAMTQEAGRTYRLGDLHLSPRNGPHNAAVFDAVKADGFIAGQNLIVDDPGFGLRISALDDYASENRQGPCGSHSFRRRAAQRATKTIPILAIADDMVKSGFVASLAKPGGNTTGVSILSTQQAAGVPARSSARNTPHGGARRCQWNLAATTASPTRGGACPWR